MPTYILLMGGPGAGKGTQAEALVQRYGLPQVASGDLFRDNLKRETELGQLAKGFMDRGELVPDDIVVAVVEERFANPREVESGFVLDGFPRTETQAEALFKILGPNRLDLVIDLEVPRDVVVERLLARNREDDNEESINRRLELYESETKPLVDFYRERGLLATVDGYGDEQEVHRRMLAAIGERLDPSPVERS